MLLKIEFLTVIFLLLCYLVTLCDSYKILAITPHVGRSHQRVFEPLFKKLVENGHSLTLITRFPPKINSPNWRTVNVAAEEHNASELLTFDIITGTKLDKYYVPYLLALLAEQTCSEGLSHPNLQNFLLEDNHYDVVLIEMFNTNCFMGVAKKFNAPIIGLHSGQMMPWMYQWFGIPYNPAYLPNQFLGYSDEMSFLERAENTFIHVYTNILYTITMGWRGSSISREHIGMDLYKNGDVMKQVSLLLINTHFTLNLPMPLVPSVIEVGGIHLDSSETEILPEDIYTFIKESKHGVIYMSMGSTIRGDSFPETKKQIFLKAFSQLRQRVIWKWEGDMVHKPNNVFISRWAPQKEILCHPNVKLFISHAGISSIVESVNCSKPMLLLPQFGDQFTNAAAVEKVGGALVLNLKETSKDSILEALKKLLSSEFAESSKNLTNRFKDRPLSPMDTALYWIDYVIKHNGADYMKTTAVDMPLYQYLLLDIMLFVFIILFTTYFFISICLKSMKQIFSKKKNKEKKC